MTSLSFSALRAVAFLLSCAFAVPVAFATDAISEDPTATQPLAIGETFPAVTVQSATGEDVDLGARLRGQPTALVFYRGGWCPYCTRQLAALGEIETELRALGFQILAISPDRPEKTAEVAADDEITAELFSDAEMKAARVAGLAFRVDDTTHERLLGFGIDLAAASGQDHRLLPVPAVFLLDATGTVQFVFADPDYRNRLDPKDLLAAARAFYTKSQKV